MRPNLPRALRMKAVTRARARVGKTRYSMKEALRAWGGMHFKNMPKMDLRKRKAVMCSGLINDAYSGKAVSKHPSLTVPPDFVRSKTMRPVATMGKFKRPVLPSKQFKLPKKLPKAPIQLKMPKLPKLPKLPKKLPSLRRRRV